MKLNWNVSQSTIRRNPHLFSVGGLQDPERKQSEGSKSEHLQLDKSPVGVGYRITLISVRKRLVDLHDNARWGAKPLVDAITNTLGFASDDNPRLRWEYAQVIGEPEGTIVRLDRIDP